MTELQPFPIIEPITSVSYELPAVHRCPFADELDMGSVTISFEVPAAVPEVRSLVAWLAGWETVRISHEAYVRDVAQCIADVTQSRVTVAGVFQTAGVTVRPVAGAVPSE